MSTSSPKKKPLVVSTKTTLMRLEGESPRLPFEDKQESDEYIEQHLIQSSSHEMEALSDAVSPRTVARHLLHRIPSSQMVAPPPSPSKSPQKNQALNQAFIPPNENQHETKNGGAEGQQTSPTRRRRGSSVKRDGASPTRSRSNSVSGGGGQQVEVRSSSMLDEINRYMMQQQEHQNLNGSSLSSVGPNPQEITDQKVDHQSHTVEGSNVTSTSNQTVVATNQTAPNNPAPSNKQETSSKFPPLTVNTQMPRTNSTQNFGCVQPKSSTPTPTNNNNESTLSTCVSSDVFDFDDDNSPCKYETIMDYLSSKMKQRAQDLNLIIPFMDRLNLSYLNFRQLPQDLITFEKLIELNLSHNLLKTFDSALIVDSCPNLVTLDLSSNLINNIEIIRDLCNLKKLVSLNISKNPIRVIDNRIIVLQNLLHFKPTEPKESGHVLNEHMKQLRAVKRRASVFVSSSSSTDGPPSAVSSVQEPTTDRSSPSNRKKNSLPFSSPMKSPIKEPPNQSTNTNTTTELYVNEPKFMLPTESSIKKDFSLVKPNPITQFQLTLKKVRQSKNAQSFDMKFHARQKENDSMMKQLIPSPRSKLKEAVKNHTPINMAPFIQSLNLTTAKTQRKTVLERDMNSARGPNTPFPSLRILNNVVITPEEYLLSLHEEIYDMCAEPVHNEVKKKQPPLQVPETAANADEEVKVNPIFLPTTTKPQKTLILKDSAKSQGRKIGFEDGSLDFTNRKFSVKATNELIATSTHRWLCAGSSIHDEQLEFG